MSQKRIYITTKLVKVTICRHMPEAKPNERIRYTSDPDCDVTDKTRTSLLLRFINCNL